MTKPTPKERGRIEGTAHFKLTAKRHIVGRGEATWTYFYVILGFALSIEATVISFIEPWGWYWKLAAFVGWGAVTFYLLLYNVPFQNMLLRFKISYEEKGTMSRPLAMRAS